MSSFEVLSSGTSKKLSPFEVERNSFDLVIKPSVKPHQESFWNSGIENNIVRLRKDLSRVDDWFKGNWKKDKKKKKKERTTKE